MFVRSDMIVWPNGFVMGQILETPSLVAEGSAGVKKNIFKQKAPQSDESISGCCWWGLKLRIKIECLFAEFPFVFFLTISHSIQFKWTACLMDFNMFDVSVRFKVYTDNCRFTVPELKVAVWCHGECCAALLSCLCFVFCFLILNAKLDQTSNVRLPNDPCRINWEQANHDWTEQRSANGRNTLNCSQWSCIQIITT